MTSNEQRGLDAGTPPPSQEVRGSDDVSKELFSALTGLMIALVGDEFADDIPAVVAAKAAIAMAKSNGMTSEKPE